MVVFVIPIDGRKGRFTFPAIIKIADSYLLHWFDVPFYMAGSSTIAQDTTWQEVKVLDHTLKIMIICKIYLKILPYYHFWCRCNVEYPKCLPCSSFKIIKNKSHQFDLKRNIFNSFRLIGPPSFKQFQLCII